MPSRNPAAASAAASEAVRMACFMASPLEELRAAVDHDRLAGDELAGVAGEIEDGAGEVFALEIALQRLVLADRDHALLELGAEEFLGPFRQHSGGRDRVDADPVAPELARQRARDADHRGL